MPDFGTESTGQEVVDAYPENVRDRISATGHSIGSAATLAFASAAPRQLILVNRNLEKSKRLISLIHEKAPSVSAIFIKCDLSSLESVKQAALEISRSVPHVDILINNAATVPGPYSQTEDGIESQFAVDYVAHFLLTNLLMPKLLAAGPGTRVVNVASSAVRHRTHAKFDDYNFSDGDTYTAFDGYIQAKLALVLFSIALAKRMETHNMQAYSLHPGSISSEMRASVSLDDWQASEKRRTEAGTKTEGTRKKTVEEGCATMLVAALDPRIAHQSGAYLKDGAVATEFIPVVDGNSEENSETLWKITERLLRSDFTWP
ncbi:hypothetical protein, variant 1 [Exophiala oligosperma]|uniref:Short-chain dehydrogenase n=1 Tax=Exophiala oligosperma TaxID=215243 RepID=A0A0D2CZY8_9EURO|nr:hypothetical protein, variant 1 [Exophiala oligosperma]KIW36568.1 hypothetical protein, variant 1 [Exophiala oligosperma]